jgi:hypothetical protein
MVGLKYAASRHLHFLFFRFRGIKLSQLHAKPSGGLHASPASLKAGGAYQPG